MAETEDYAQTPEAHAASHEAGGSDVLKAASYVNRWTRPGRLYASDGTTLKQLRHSTSTLQALPANGDKIQMFLLCDGTETQICLTTLRGSTCGIFDLYINDTLDSAGYDQYNATAGVVHNWITTTQQINPGLNLIELRVNNKNVSSSSYAIQVQGLSVQ